MNEKDFKNSKYYRNKLSPLEISTMYKKNHSTDIKKEENNPENNSLMAHNSIRNLTIFNESTSLDSKILHIIRKPYKIFLPIKNKIRNIKNSRQIYLNNYYKGTLRKQYLLKDKSITDSFNTNIKINSSKVLEIIPKINSNGLKSSFNGSNISNVCQNNMSKKSIILSTERTNTTKEMTNYNISNISKINKSNNDYSQYKIFTNQSNNNNRNNNSLYTKFNISYEANNNFKTMRFIDMNQGYKNLKNLDNCANYFSNQVKNLFKEKQMNICLKEREARIKEYKEINNEKIKIDMKSKFNVNGLFHKFYKDYNTYCNRLIAKTNETNKIDLLKWQIISYKNDINRLNIKKEKLFMKINKYMHMKNYLMWLKRYVLEIKNDFLIYNPNYISRHSSKNLKDLIKDYRKIKEPEENEIQKKIIRRRSICKFNMIKAKPNELMLIEEREDGKKHQKKNRRFSVAEKDPIFGSGVNDIVSILNNHIADLLIYYNKLRLDIEPLKEEFEKTYNSLKESDEKENEILKKNYIILPEKKRIAIERNEFLTNTLVNINNDIFYSCNYNKMNIIIREKLSKIYQVLLDNKIINYRIDIVNSGKIKTVNDKIIFYLKNIENGINFLIARKKDMKDKYPQEYNDIIDEIYFGIKMKTFESQKKKDLLKGKKNSEEIINMMTKSFILNRRKDFYNYECKKKHKKKKLERVDSYEELRYSDDN